MTRRLSHWAWGYEDKLPDEATRRGLGQGVSAMLGFGELTLGALPRLEDARVRPARVRPPEALAAFCTDDREARIRHTHGRGYRDVLRGFQGDFESAPDLVATPRDEADVVRALDWASDARVAVIPYGGGTSVVGGVEAVAPPGFAGTMSLDLRGLDRVLEVDARSLSARIEAGATGPRLEAQLAEHGLTLRCFPQSFELSTLGGWIATRAGGHFTTVYTHVDDLVQATRTVTPTGTMQTRRLPASGAGPSPDRLVLGSEGTLGVITEAWMRVRPRPVFRSTATVFFDDFRAAVDAVRELSQSGLYPTNCRLLDAREAKLNFVANDGSHVLVLGFESADHPQAASTTRALEITASRGGRCPKGALHREAGERTGGEGGAGAWRAAFLEGPYLMGSLVSLGVVVDTFETACTWDRFDDLHAAVVREVRAAMKDVAGAGFVSCRFTHVYPDGPAPYYTFLAPGRPGAELEQHAAIKRAASEALIANGATITHHHAVGRLHRPWYDRQRPAPFARALAAVKRELDPAGILNPGVLIDPSPSPAPPAPPFEG